MAKSLKLLVAGLVKIGKYPLIESNIGDDSLQELFRNTSSDVRAVLCYFSVSFFWLFYLSLLLCSSFDFCSFNFRGIMLLIWILLSIEVVFSKVDTISNEIFSLQDVMRARDLEMPKLLDSDIPALEKPDGIQNAFLIYRDTINFLEYIKQVFEKMNQTLIE